MQRYSNSLTHNGCITAPLQLNHHSRPTLATQNAQKVVLKDLCYRPYLLSALKVVNCLLGHKPYPYGVCLKCAPPNVHVRDQPYRHVDIASVPGTSDFILAVIIIMFYMQFFVFRRKVDCRILSTLDERVGIMLLSFLPLVLILISRTFMDKS